jgi:hypothetical protein
MRSTPDPVVVDVLVDPTELPSMPRVGVGQAWKFGIGKLREVLGA